MPRLLRQCHLAVLSVALLSLAMVAPAAGQGNDASSNKPSGFEKIDGTTLKPATLSYDATVKTGSRSRDLSSTLLIAANSIGHTDTWTLLNEIKTPRGTITDSLVVGRSSLLPISRHRSGGAALAVTFTDTSASGEMETGGQTMSISSSLEGPTLAGGVHDVIALAAMPLTSDFSTTLRVFSPQDQTTKRAAFEVTGTETVETSAGSFEVYVVDLNVGDGYVTGTVHLRKKPPHYYVKWKTEVTTARGTRTLTQTLRSMKMSSSSSGR